MEAAEESSGLFVMFMMSPEVLTTKVSMLGEVMPQMLD